MTHTDPAKPLDYAPPPPLHRQRKLLIRFFAIIVAVAVIVTVIGVAPQAYLHVQVLLLQRQLGKYEAPPRQTIFKKFDSLYEVRHDPLWAKAQPTGLTNAIIFIGPRSAGSSERLVTVEIGSVVSTDQLFMVSRVAEPARLARRTRPLSTTPSMLNVDLHFERSIEIFAGQRDPNDPSHFTIECIVDGEEIRTFDGWLLADDTVIIERRREP